MADRSRRWLQIYRTSAADSGQRACPGLRQDTFTVRVLDRRRRQPQEAGHGLVVAAVHILRISMNVRTCMSGEESRKSAVARLLAIGTS
jgi:hypothetical protein